MTVRTANQIARYRERMTRGQILDAARFAFARAGYRTHVRDIVGAGDFSLSTLYRYFPEGKDQILLQLFAQLQAEVAEDMKHIAAMGDARERLEAWMDVGFEKVDRYGLLASAVATGNLPGPHRELLPIRDLYQFTGRLIKEAVARGDLAEGTQVREAVRVWFALVAPERIRGCLRDEMTIREIRDLTLGYFFKLFSRPEAEEGWEPANAKR